MINPQITIYKVAISSRAGQPGAPWPPGPFTIRANDAVAGVL
ncbi:hypothetical protein AB0395_27770 [Streptosporangium sp. NPDC051023]